LLNRLRTGIPWPGQFTMCTIHGSLTVTPNAE